MFSFNLGDNIYCYVYIWILCCPSSEEGKRALVFTVFYGIELWIYYTDVKRKFLHPCYFCFFTISVLENCLSFEGRFCSFCFLRLRCNLNWSSWHEIYVWLIKNTESVSILISTCRNKQKLKMLTKSSSAVIEKKVDI